MADSTETKEQEIHHLYFIYLWIEECFDEFCKTKNSDSRFFILGDRILYLNGLIEGKAGVLDNLDLNSLSQQTKRCYNEIKRINSKLENHTWEL